jgi:hypothetical protein
MTIALVAFGLGSPAGHRLTGVTVDLVAFWALVVYAIVALFRGNATRSPH